MMMPTEERATLHLRPPFDFPASISFWRNSTGELCEHWSDGIYRRVVDLHGAPVLLALRNVGSVDAPAVELTVDERRPTADELRLLAPLARHLLGDDLDLHAFYAACANDPLLAEVTHALYGLKAPRSPLWETLCFVIIGQQISVPFAYKLKERLVTRYGTRFAAAGRPLYRFPAPEVVAAIDPAELAPLQFSRNKASFLIGLAQDIVAGRLELERVAALATDAAVTYLTQFRGIGFWSAEFTLLRALGRADALPANDAGVRQGIHALYGERLPEQQLRAFAARWQAWRGVVGLYLLAWLRTQRPPKQ